MDDQGKSENEVPQLEMEFQGQQIDWNSGSNECMESPAVDPILQVSGVEGDVKDNPVDMQVELTEGCNDLADKGLESVQVSDNAEEPKLLSFEGKNGDGDIVCKELQSYGDKGNVEISLDNAPNDSFGQINSMLKDDAMDVDDYNQVNKQLDLFESPDQTKNKIYSKSQSTGHKDDTENQINLQSQLSNASMDNARHIFESELHSPDSKNYIEHHSEPQLQPEEDKDHSDLHLQMTEVEDDVLKRDSGLQPYVAEDNIIHQDDVILQSPKVKEYGEDPVDIQVDPPEVKAKIDGVRQTFEVMQDVELPINAQFQSHEAKGDAKFCIGQQQIQSPQANNEQQQRYLALQSWMSSMPSADEMLGVLTKMETSFANCLPQEELKNIDFYSGPSQEVDAMPKVNNKIPAEEVVKNMENFMSAAKKLQKYFTRLQQPDPPSRADILRKEIAMMEDELKIKDGLNNKHQKKLEGWRKDVAENLSQHKDELRKV